MSDPDKDILDRLDGIETRDAAVEWCALAVREIRQLRAKVAVLEAQLSEDDAPVPPGLTFDAVIRDVRIQQTPLFDRLKSK